jgi:hypothetical protein
MGILDFRLQIENEFLNLQSAIRNLMSVDFRPDSSAKRKAPRLEGLLFS